MKTVFQSKTLRFSKLWVEWGWMLMSSTVRYIFHWMSTPKNDSSPNMTSGRGGFPNKLKLIAGGGKTKRKTIKDEKLRDRLQPHIPITICDWDNWLLGCSSMKLDAEMDALVGRG